ADQQLVLGHQLLPALDPVGVQRNAVHGADLLTLGLVEMADALGAQVRVDDVDFLALGNGPVRAFRFADVAVDAVVGNHQGHGLLRNKAGQPWERLSSASCTTRWTNLLTSPPSEAISRTRVEEI